VCVNNLSVCVKKESNDERAKRTFRENVQSREQERAFDFGLD